MTQTSRQEIFTTFDRFKALVRNSIPKAAFPKKLEFGALLNDTTFISVKLNRKQNLRVRRLTKETRIGLGEAGALTSARDKRMMVILHDREARACMHTLHKNLPSQKRNSPTCGNIRNPSINQKLSYIWSLSGEVC